MDRSEEMGIPRQRLLENITVLWILNEIPDIPRRNLLPSNSDSTRQLTIERERDLADCFAFLSARTDDMMKVMAVCVEEDLDHAGLTIRMAANTGPLTDVEKGLRNIAILLETASLRVNSRVTDEGGLLREVIRFDSARILSRLRSRHAKKTQKTRGKPALLSLLNTSMNDSSIKPQAQVTADTLTELRRKTAQLLRLFLDFEDTLMGCEESISEESIVSLAILLQQSFELVSRNDLQAALATSTTIDQGLKHFLPEALGKLGRYYSVSCDLVLAARGSNRRIFQRISVATVDISRPSGKLIRDQTSTLRTSVRNIIDLGRRESMDEQLERYLSKRRMAAEQIFESRLYATSNHWKVHAEIKLLFHYEIHPTSNRPRVLSSSKSACYLCNLFIGLHGQFHVPTTHGRLYDRWILPDWIKNIAPGRRQRLNSLICQFNAELEKKIRLTLEAQRASRNHPNESILIPRVHWSSSVLPTPVSSIAVPDTGYNGGDADCTGESKSNLAASTSDSLPNTQASTATEREQIRNQITRVSKSDSTATSLTSLDQEPLGQLTRGHWRWKRLPDYKEILVATNGIHLTLSGLDNLGSGGNGSDETARTRWVRMKWLDPDEQAAVDIKSPNVVETNALRNSSQITVAHGGYATPSELYIVRGRDMVCIKFELRPE